MDVLLALVKDASVSGINLVALIIALTQCIKGFGVSGVQIKITGFVVGFLLGVGYQLQAHGVPVDLVSWFTPALFGLVFGLVGPSFYDATFRKE